MVRAHLVAAAMTAVPVAGHYTVVVEATLARPGGVSDIATRVLEALLDREAEDPCVSTDATGPAIRVELVAKGHTHTEALAHGVQLINRALASIGVATAVPLPLARVEGLAA